MDSLISCGQRANSCNKIIMRFQKLIRIGVDSVWTGLQFNWPTVRESKIVDSGFHTVDSGFQSLSVELGVWIQIVSGIPDSKSCIPDSKAQDFRFHE